MKTKHTEGKWSSVERSVIANGQVIAVTKRVIGGEKGEHEANAKLIAAAPELLEVLKELDSIMQKTAIDLPIYFLVKHQNAIKKATE